MVELGVVVAIAVAVLLAIGYFRGWWVRWLYRKAVGDPDARLPSTERHITPEMSPEDEKKFVTEARARWRRRGSRS